MFEANSRCSFRATPPEFSAHVYKQGQHMLRYISARFGLTARNAWLRAMARGRSLDEATREALGLPFADLDIRVRKARPELLCRGGVHHGDILRAELPRLLLEPVHIPPRRKREHGNTKTAGCLSSLPSDGAGGA